MPPRKARSSVAQPAKRSANNKNRKRQLDAFAIAGKVAPEKSKVRRHRLGEVEDNQPTSKRRRSDDSDDEDEEEPDDRREKRRRQQDGAEDVEYGSDSEGNEWTIGAVDDDDESLDSDEAFGESDEERFEGFTFRGSSNKSSSKSKRVQQKPVALDDIDLNEEGAQESDEEDDFGEEGVDLATMLDGPPSDDTGDDEESGPEEDEEPSSVEEEEDDEDDEQRHARLQDFVEGLDQNSRSKKPVILQDSDNDMLTLDDLLEDADLDSKTLATLKPKRKQAPELVKSALPKRQQDAIDRKLANKKAKEQLDRWRDTVMQNRRAEFLSFPLRNTDEGELPSKDTFAPTQQAAPSTELEASIRQIMEESGMTKAPAGRAEDEGVEGDILKAEELAVKQQPVEEVLARRAELRRTRDLLFREEIKAKRIAKIKSKSYRRVHRKDRERLADKERMLMDPEAFANGELNADEQDEADRRRAEARMSAKHKDSKWARSLRATDRATWDDDARAGVIEQAKRQEELRRRIAGHDIDDSDATNNDDDDDDDEQFGGNATQELKRLAESDAQDGLKGLAAMKFMQTAEARRRQQNDAAIADLQRDLNSEAEDDDSAVEDNGLGRAIFGPKPTASAAVKQKKRAELEEGPLSEDDELDDTTVSRPLQDKIKPAVSAIRKDKQATSSAKSAKSSKHSAMSDVANVRSVDESATTSAWLTAPRGKKSKLDRKLAQSADNEALIDTRMTLKDRNPSIAPQDKGKESNAGNTDGWTTVPYQNADPETEDVSEAPLLSKAERNAAFHARAFAGDDVALQFDAEKDALIASEDEKESSSHMPGWGSWAGSGLSKGARKAAERARHNPLYKTKLAGIKPQDRKDAKLEKVIISEKSDRKGKKYLAPTLPHQFERKEEYERSIRMPLGPEWTTKEVFQHGTRPRVVVKPGTIIEPMSRPLV